MSQSQSRLVQQQPIPHNRAGRAAEHVDGSRRPTHRAGRLRRILPGLLLGLVFGWQLPAGGIVAIFQLSPPAAANLLSAAEPVPTIDSLIERHDVPADKPELWPVGIDDVMPRRDFEQLLDRARQAAPPAASGHLESGLWSATLVGETLHGHTVEFQARGPRAGRGVLPLEPLGVSLRDLSWENGPAVFGTARSGRTFLVIDREAGHLTGQWSLKGRQAIDGLEFLIKLPSAMVTQLQLELPSRYSVQVDRGDLERLTADPSAELTNWRVLLGSDSQVRLLLRQTDEVPPPPQVLYDTELTAEIRDEAVTVTGVVQCEVLGQPVRTLTIDIPAALELFSVSSAKQTISGWQRTELDGSRHRLMLTLPDPIMGKAWPIQLQGILLSRSAAPLNLPALRLNDGLFRSGTISVEVSAPLQVRSFQLSGARLAQPMSSANSTESLTFQQTLADASLKLEITRPPIQATTRVLTHLLPAEDAWQATSEINWTIATGQLFRVDCRIPHDWDVQDVLVVGAKSGNGLASWDVQPQQDGQLLSVELSEAVTPAAAKTIRLLLRRTLPPLGQPLPLPVPVPLSGDLVPTRLDSSESWFAISQSATTTIRLSSDSEFETVPIASGGTEWKSSALWQSITQRGNDWQLWKGDALDNPGNVVASSRLQPVEALAFVQLEYSPAAVTELYQIDLQPVGDGVDRLLIYLTGSTAEPIQWICAQAEVTAARRPTARHADWGLSPAGSLWELTLSRSLTEPIRVTGQRTVPRVAGPFSFGLAFVPQATTFTGIARVGQDSPESLESLGLRALTAATWNELRGRHSEAGLPASVATAWLYASPNDQLNLSAEPSSQTPEEPLFALVELQSRLSPHNSGYGLHTAKLSIRGTRGSPRSLRLELPEGVESLTVRVDGESVAPVRERTAIQVPLSGSPATWRTVEWVYRTPHAASWLSESLSIPVPAGNFRIWGLTWELGLPRSDRLFGTPTDITWLQGQSELTWTERWFGIAGRGISERFFRPWSLAAWWPTANPVALTELDQTVQTFRAIVPVGRSRLEVRVWNHRELEVLGWCILVVAAWLALWSRVENWSGRHHAGAISLVAATALSGFAPAPFSMLAGSAFSGLVLAALCPRRIWRLGRGALDPEWQRTAGLAGRSADLSRRTLGRSGAIVGLLICLASGLWMPGSPIIAWAQSGSGSAIRRSLTPTDSTANSQRARGDQRMAPSTAGTGSTVSADDIDRDTAGEGSPARLFRLLVPVDTQGQPSAAFPVVYLERGLRRTLEDRIQQFASEADYLLESATYRAQIDDVGRVTIQATHRVWVIADRPTVAIDFGYRGVNLRGGESCLVDGRGGVVLADARAGGFTIDLPGTTSSGSVPGLPQPEAHEVQFAFQFAATVNGKGGRLRFQTPAAPDSELDVEFVDPVVEVELEQALGELVTSLDQRGCRVELGLQTLLELSWYRQRPEPAEPVSIDARVLGLIDVHSTGAEAHALVELRFPNERARAVEFSIPPGVVLRDVRSLDGEIRTAFHRPQLEQPGRLQVQWAEPRTGPRVLLLPLWWPDRGNGTDLETPFVLPVNSQLSNVRITEFLLGVTAPAEFRVELSTPTGVLQRGLKPEQLLARWQGGVPPLQPQQTFAIAADAVPTIRRQPVSTQRQISRGRYSARVSRRAIEWQLSFELEAPASPTFTHSLLVPVGLAVESLSVEEGGAERLLRYSDHRLTAGAGQFRRLLLFLTDPVTGPQTITLKAREQVRLGDRVSLLPIRLEDMQINDLQLAVTIDPELQTELTQARGLRELEVAGSRLDPATGFRLLGRYQVVSEEPRPMLAIRARQVSNPVHLIQTVVPAEAGRWLQRIAMVFPAENLVSEDCRYLLPGSAEAPWVIDSTDVKASLETEGSMQQLRVEPDLPRASEGFVFLSRLLPSTETNEWTIGLPVSLDAELTSRWIVPGQSGLTWDPMVLARDPLPTTPLWFQEVQKLWQLSTDAALIPVDLEQATVRWETAPPGASVPAVLRAEHHVQLLEDGSQAGVSQFWVKPHTAPLHVSWSPFLMLRGLLVDGVPRWPVILTDDSQSTGAESSRSMIVIEPATEPRRLTVCWQSATSLIPLLGTQVSPERPRIDEAEPVSQWLTVRLPSTWSAPFSPSPLPQWMSACDRLEFLLRSERALADDVFDGPTDGDLLRHGSQQLEYWLQRQNRLTARLGPGDLKAWGKIVEQLDRLNGPARSTPAWPNGLLTFVENPSLSDSGARWITRLESNETDISLPLVPQSWVSWLLGAGWIVVVWPLTRRLVRQNVGRWMVRHNRFAWILLGLVWWCCLQWSAIGFCLCAAACCRSLWVRTMQPSPGLVG